MARTTLAFLLTVVLWLSPVPAAAQLLYVPEGIPASALATRWCG